MRGGSGGGGIEDWTLASIGTGEAPPHAVAAAIPHIDAAIDALVHVLVTTVLILFTAVVGAVAGGMEFGDWFPEPTLPATSHQYQC